VTPSGVEHRLLVPGVVVSSGADRSDAVRR
jgi:hypothetical protein